MIPCQGNMLMGAQPRSLVRTGCFDSRAMLVLLADDPEPKDLLVLALNSHSRFMVLASGTPY